MATTTFALPAAAQTPNVSLGPVLRFVAILASSFSWAQSVRRVYARSGSATFADFHKAGV